MTHGSLYSGIGGWLLAAQWAGIENIFTCEIDKFCNKVLDKHFPNTDRHYDIKETDFTKYAGRIDILSTSDPCQPFSFAGKRGGKADDRFLWPFTIEAIRAIKPAYVVFENVPGFISMAFETVASDLEAEGYTVESFIIPACAVGAWHRRDRLWVIAYTRHTESQRRVIIEERQQSGEWREAWSFPAPLNSDVSDTADTGIKNVREWENPSTVIDGNKTSADTQCSTGKQCGNDARMGRERKLDEKGSGIKGGDYWQSEPNVGRVANGVPNRVDRLKSLGNAIVPQIAYIIFEAIKNAEAH